MDWKPLVGIIPALIGIALANDIPLDAEAEFLEANRALRPAYEKYLAAINAAEDNYRKAHIEAAAEYVKRLQQLQQFAGKAGKVDAAIALREEERRVASLAKTSALSPAAVIPLAGAWEIHYTNGATRTYNIDASGQISSKDSNARIKLKDGSLIAKESSVVERFVLDGDRLIVEHYNARRGSDFAKGTLPDCVGFGARVADRSPSSVR